jgi:DNA-directed RNA polymerase subunit F
VLDKILAFFDHRLTTARDITNTPTIQNEDILNAEQRHALHHASTTYMHAATTSDLLHMLMAANYLHCEILIDIISSIIASRIMGKSRDEMRSILGIENDFNEEEEAQVLAESAWALAKCH